jgi:ribose-phosphate pyrophosphokinase
MGDIKIFAGSSGAAFAARMCDYLGIEPRPTETIRFSEGNTYVKIGEHVRDEEVYLVQSIGGSPGAGGESLSGGAGSTGANDDFVELLFWMDAFKRSGAKYVTAVVPYFSYAKGDKKDEPRVSIRARVVAESIELAGADRIITMDLHAPQIQGFFKKPVDHLYARPVLGACIGSLGIEDLVIVSPDAGFAKNARKYASCLGLPLVIADKTRACNDERAEILDIIGKVRGRNAMIVDDFSLSGNTLVELCRKLKAEGARRVFACLSHLPISEAGIANVENSDIEYVISTDSAPGRLSLDPARFKIVSVAPLFAEVVSRMQNRVAIGDLMDAIPERMLAACSRGL